MARLRAPLREIGTLTPLGIPDTPLALETELPEPFVRVPGLFPLLDRIKDNYPLSHGIPYPNPPRDLALEGKIRSLDRSRCAPAETSKHLPGEDLRAFEDALGGDFLRRSL